MPDLLRASVEFAYQASLAVWVGGVAALGFIAPRVERSRVALSRALDPLRTLCAVVFAVASIVKYSAWETNVAWYHVRYTLAAILIATGLFAAHAISPRLDLLRRGQGEVEPEPRREALERLTRLAHACALVEVIVGAAVLFLSVPA